MRTIKLCIGLVRAIHFSQRNESQQSTRFKAAKVMVLLPQIILSMINSFYTQRETYINDKIFRAHCKEIGIYSGWNKRSSGFGCLRVTYLEV
jgi:hypothetical protein